MVGAPPSRPPRRSIASVSFIPKTGRFWHKPAVGSAGNGIRQRLDRRKIASGSQQFLSVRALDKHHIWLFDRPGEIFGTGHVLNLGPVFLKALDPPFLSETVCPKMVVERFTADRAFDGATKGRSRE